MCVRSLAPVVLATLLVVMTSVAPAIAAPSSARAQDGGSAPASGTTTSGTTATDSGATSTSSTAPRTEETRSEVGGSTARITRGGDPTTAPVRSTRAGEDEREVPVNEEDDGRKADFIWLEVEGGISYVDLVALSQSNFSTPEGVVTTPSFEAVRGTGPTFGAALGFRLLFLAVGARVTLASYGDFEIGTVGGEVQLRLPTPVVEPWVRIGAGYAWQGNADYEMPTASQPTVYGWAMSGAIGLDVFVTWWLTLGIGGGVDFLNMTRQSDPTQSCMGITEFCPAEEGDAIGVQGRGTIQAGLHF